MNKKSILRVTGIAAAACFFVCEPVPQNAITDARTVLEKADSSGALTYFPVQLKKGHAFYDSAMKELSVEKKKLPFKRNYKKIIELLDIAAEAGYYSLESMQAVNGRRISHCRELLDRATVLADSVDTLLNWAMANKMDVGLLRAALDSAKMVQKEALVALSEDLPLAKEKATAAYNKIEELVKNSAGFLSPQKKSAGKRKF